MTLHFNCKSRFGILSTAAKRKRAVSLTIQQKYDIITCLDNQTCSKQELSDKYKVNGSIARAMIKNLAAAGTIKRVGDHHASFDLYTGTQAKSALEKAAEEAAAAAAKKK